MSRSFLFIFGAIGALTAINSHFSRTEEMPPIAKIELAKPTTRTLAALQDARIAESSGLASSRRFADWLWTHNDSGDTARAFLIDKAGATRHVINLRDVTAIDWEDCAVAPDTRGESWLYLGDIGDNEKNRANITVYRVAESTVDAKHAEQTIASVSQQLVYPDGAHDAETLIATHNERLIIVTKSIDGSSIYITPNKFSAGSTQTLRKLGDLKFGSVSIFARLATGGSLAPDGKRLVIRTYTHAYEWDLSEVSIDGQWLKNAQRKFVLPVQRQGEAIAYATDSQTLLTTSEKLPTPLDEIAFVNPSFHDTPVEKLPR
jgi:hypothetical protein